MDYKEDLRKRLPELKKIEGFPVGEEEDIINLSSPPFYTACPNPYIAEFVEKNGTKYDEENDKYYKEPFIDDIDNKKVDSLSVAHSYHTKSPFKAIAGYIEHYTNPGDLVLDCFSGSGMTGLASQLTNRKAIQLDLSPFATFLSSNYSNSVDHLNFIRKGNELAKKVLDKYGHLLNTKHKEGKYGVINSVLFSEHFICPYCNSEYVYWDTAIDETEKKLNDDFSCNNCESTITRKESSKATKLEYDKYFNEESNVVKSSPVEIVYTFNKKRYRKKPDEEDIALIESIENLNIPYWFPTEKMMHKGEGWGDTWRRGVHTGVTRINHLFTKRNLLFLSCLYEEINKISDENLKRKFLATFTSLLLRSSKKAILHVSNYFGGGGGYISTISGNWYIPSLWFEVPIIEQWQNRLKKINVINKNRFEEQNVLTSTQSGNDLSNIPNSSIDFIFVDPPFGDNLQYAELNFMYEGWLKVYTNDEQEAVINKTKSKSISEYENLLGSCFDELYRVLKPKRWITIEYHNSKSAIWNALVSSLNKSGFVIGHTAVMKNKGKSFVINAYANSVSNDLVISAYKPSKNLETKLVSEQGVGAELSFVQEFLEKIVVLPILERTDKLLYSKLISYYIQKGYSINLDANSFYNLLAENFIEEDGYWFTSNQINSYTEYKKKVKLENLDGVKQGSMVLFVSDERTALLWLFDFLNVPKTFSDIHTAFTQIANIQGDQVPELLQLLEDNFVKENNIYRRPSSQEEHKSINTKREKTLLREFESLLLRAKNERKKIKQVRKEALVYGFEVCYKDKRFKDVLLLEERLDKKIIENSSELNDFVEAAKIMVEGIN